MKYLMNAALIALALSAFGPTVRAQQQPTPAAMAAATELISVTGATALFNPLISGVVEQAKIFFLQQDPSLGKDLNEIAAKLKTELQPRFSELNGEVAKLYAGRFSEQELKDLLAFYKSPLGQKLLAQQPQIIDGSMKFAQEWSNKLSDEVIAKMRDELRKRGHKM